MTSTLSYLTTFLVSLCFQIKTESHERRHRFEEGSASAKEEMGPMPLILTLWQRLEIESTTGVILIKLKRFEIRIRCLVHLQHNSRLLHLSLGLGVSSSSVEGLLVFRLH